MNHHFKRKKCIWWYCCFDYLLVFMICIEQSYQHIYLLLVHQDFQIESWLCFMIFTICIASIYENSVKIKLTSVSSVYTEQLHQVEINVSFWASLLFYLTSWGPDLDKLYGTMVYDRNFTIFYLEVHIQNWSSLCSACFHLLNIQLFKHKYLSPALS